VKSDAAFWQAKYALNLTLTACHRCVASQRKLALGWKLCGLFFLAHNVCVESEMPVVFDTPNEKS